MFSVKIELYFSSAHFLEGYKGKCEALHGHNWKVEATAEAEKTGEAGMLLDFKDFKAELNKVLENLDHKCLNDIAYFSAAGGSASGGKKVNPTSENIARYIYDALKPQVINLKLITVWESHNCCASYYE